MEIEIRIDGLLLTQQNKAQQVTYVDKPHHQHNLATKYISLQNFKNFCIYRKLTYSAYIGLWSVACIELIKVVIFIIIADEQKVC